ncbi:type VII secretion system-associated protein [Amycolatopsis sp. NPDC058986]|uniref:type VII secretion system-associated protein n=1 Tax=unclassified Amycolatopsis TaxID=2618356 RepID=UPI00366C4016
MAKKAPAAKRTVDVELPTGPDSGEPMEAEPGLDQPERTEVLRAGTDEAAAEGVEGEEGGEDSLDLSDHWVFMIDPAWKAADEKDQPPIEAVVGGWYVDDDGETGLFRPNPDYQPSQPDLPTDPVDAALQLVVRGEVDGDELLKALPDIVYGVALDEDGTPVVALSPDDVPSVLVTTAPAHRERVNVSGWMEVTMGELAEALPDEGIDVLLNPGAPASMRLLAGTMKESATAAAK